MNSHTYGEGSALPSEISLYIHIPFCQTKCPYCDFNTYAGIEALIPDYVEALVREILFCGAHLGRPGVSTVFFGGGTPSYLPNKAIAAILDAAHSSFLVSPDAEVTLEANPGDLSDERLRFLLRTGINRLSIGVQSLEEPLLKVLGRRHSAQEAVEAYRRARQAGFANISLDMMYGTPYQNLEQWRNTLHDALALSPEHLSLYCLTLEGGTPMEQQVDLGNIPQPDPDLAADMYLMAEDMLGQAGYRHYEISNWAKPGMESRHNLTYWLNRPYLGVGPGAHSYLGRYRFHNIRSPKEYVRRLKDTSAPPHGVIAIHQEALTEIPTVEDIETIDEGLEMAETMMLGMRLEEGIGLESFALRFGKSLSSVYGEQIQELTSLGLVEQSEEALHLTSRGHLLGNEVFLRFFEG
jgi:oxygen-independent coproporphyrinogen-3 oxidase